MAQWIIPCNVKMYDVEGAFKRLKCIDWKQSNRSIAIEDDVYIYVGKPIYAIKYKCKANRVNYGTDEAIIDDSEFVLDGALYEDYGNYMELELIEEYDSSKFSLDVLIANGLKGRIQGPRHVNELEEILNSDDNNWVNALEKEIDESNLCGKEKEAIVKIRVNQSVYREKLLSQYSSCCLCGVSDDRMLVASHIKPWSKSDSKEKIDVNNGLLLCPNHDKVFDSGLITFDNNGNIIISPELGNNDRIFLNVREDMKLNITEKSIKYIRYHRNYIFRKGE